MHGVISLQLCDGAAGCRLANHSLCKRVRCLWRWAIQPHHCYSAALDGNFLLGLSRFLQMCQMLLKQRPTRYRSTSGAIGYSKFVSREMSKAEALLKIFELKEEFMVGILSMVSLLESLGGGRASDMIGRKWTMAVAAVVFQSGTLTMTLAHSFSVLMIGILLACVGIGFGVVIAPIYIAEISPNISRGTFTSFLEIFINIGILLGYVSNYAFSGFSGHINWRIMLVVGILPSMFIGFALFVIPESPRWLVIQNRIEEARQVLLKTIENKKEVDERLAEIQQAAGVPSKEDKPVYYSLYRHVERLAEEIKKGANSIDGVEATLWYLRLCRKRCLAKWEHHRRATAH
ncbi:hypothetical protein Ahy_B05g076694 [Arachis hypogaea]|uniref:Major facilitator superfamily (MFS) profile domain-containing protein n=1 Tax=Arachis hypogaea TaxID=3818 RepID=A0A444Z430_ARAHY|nr:hypothetical protein Ahy_B05g076694 [Arachis hypogaea]